MQLLYLKELQIILQCKRKISLVLKIKNETVLLITILIMVLSFFRIKYKSASSIFKLFVFGAYFLPSF